MRRIVVVSIFLLMLSTVNGLPTGVGSIGDNGCTCHGGADSSTTVSITGLPSNYTSSSEYNLSLMIDSSIEKNEVQGGFRILISHGEIIGDGWQIIDEGYTHTEDINDRRNWTAKWIAPNLDDELVTVVVYGNAVNGGGSPAGDAWNSASYAVPGMNYSGEVIAPDVDASVSAAQIGVGILGLLLLLGVAVIAIRD